MPACDDLMLLMHIPTLPTLIIKPDVSYCHLVCCVNTEEWYFLVNSVARNDVMQQVAASNMFM